MIRCGAIVGLVSLAGTAFAGQPSPYLPCSDLSQRAGMQRYLAIGRMPEAAVAALMRHMGGTGTEPADIAAMIAPRDADWQVTDVVMGRPLPFRRFIMAIGSANRMLIWYESGGLAHAYHLTTLEASAGGDAWRLVSDRQGALQQLCDAAAATGH